MSAEVEQLAADVVPYGDRCTVVASLVDEEQRPSGLVLPIHDEDDVHRGVVTAVGWDDTDSHIAAGTVVWYISGWRIGDVTVVPRDHIVAWSS